MTKIRFTKDVRGTDRQIVVVQTVEGFYFVATRFADGALVSDEVAFTRYEAAVDAALIEWERQYRAEVAAR